jgi:hypothetical protein
MKGRTASVMVALSTIAVLAMSLTSPALAVVAKPTIYNSIPTTLPGNVPSQPFQAQQTSEFGDAVRFAAGPTNRLKNVTVVMSSWACQAGTWNGGDCVTTPGATFAIPIRLTLYQVNTGDPTSPGAFIATTQKTFNIPYRPSADAVNCPAEPEKWYSSGDATCYNGFANKIVFGFSNLKVLLPSQVVYGISYNTSGFGPNPQGYDNPCNATTEGCPYDSLNVSAAAGLPRRGTDLYPNGVFLNSATPSVYCDGGLGGTGTFRLDDGCWTGFNPMVQFRVRAV